MATKTQSKTTTVSALASKIKVDNILQLTLVQSTLQANFKAILEALTEHDSDILKNKEDTKHNQDNLKNLKSSHELMAKEIQDLKEALAKLSKESSAIKTLVSSHEKKNSSNNSNPNPEADLKNAMLDQIKKQLSAIREKQNQLQSNFSKNVEATRSQIEKLKKDLSQLSKTTEATAKMQETNGKLKQIQKVLKDMEGKNKQISIKMEKVQNQVSKTAESKENFSDISKLMQDLNKRLEDFSNQQYKQNSEGINERLSKLQKLTEENKSAVEDEKRLRTKLGQELWKVHDTVSKVSENNFSQEMTNDTLKQLKRQLADLQKKMNELSSLSPNKRAFNDTTAYTHLNESPNKVKTFDNQSPNKSDLAISAELKEEILQKIKQVKSDMMKYLKKMDFKNEGDSAFDKKRLDIIDESLMRLDHLLSEKAGTESVKKLIAHIESKVQYIYNVFLSGESEEDACVARKNWVCLSCDKNLEKYQGRLGNYLVNDKLRVKNLEQDTVGGGMTLRPSKSKVDLPNVYKTAKKI